MRDLDATDMLYRWWRSPYALGMDQGYTPQGYEGFEAEDRAWEMYLMALMDFDLVVYLCFSVRSRPYLASNVTLNGETPEGMGEMRDHLFVEVPLWGPRASVHGAVPVFRHAWHGHPHQPFESTPVSYRDVMAAFMDFIDQGEF